jgi:hypothetical protein
MTPPVGISRKARPSCSSLDQTLAIEPIKHLGEEKFLAAPRGRRDDETYDSRSQIDNRSSR